MWEKHRERKRKDSRVFQKKSVGAVFSRVVKNYYVMYTLCFLVFFLAVFAQFLLNGKSLVWGSDGITQGYPGIVYTRRWIREFLHNFFTTGKLQGRMWDMTIGEGFNVLNVLSFRPLTLFSLLFSEESLECFFWFRAAISLYIGGVAFSCFCKLFKRLDYACLIASLLYTFGGMTIGYFYRQALFMEFIIYLPIILYGTEKILRRESGKAFVISVALAGLSYFYILYMITVFAVMYAAVRYWFVVKDKKLALFFAEIGRFVIYYGTGLGLAAVSLLPNLMMAFSSNRLESENRVGLSLLYSWDYYRSLISAVMDLHNIGTNGFLGFTVIGVWLMLVLLVGGKVKDRRTMQLRLMLIIGCIMMLFPVFALFMNGGGGITQRWFFAAAFGGGLIVAFELEREWLDNSITKKDLWFLTGYLLCFFWSSTWENNVLNYLAFFFLYLSVYLWWRDCKRTVFNQKMMQGILMGVLLLEVSYKACDYYKYDADSMLALFPKMGTVSEENDHVAAESMKYIHDEDIYRVDSVELNKDGTYANKNYGERVGVNGLSTFYSYAGKEYINTLVGLGVSRRVTGFDFSSYDQRTVLDELSAVKYVAVANDMRNYVPYGYEAIYSKEEVSVFRNQYSLPLIYGYQTVIANDDYNKLSANLKEQAMLQGAVIGEDGNNMNLPVQDMAFDAEEVLNKNEILAQMKEQPGNYVLSKNSIACNELSRFEIQLPYAVTGEVYILFEGLSFEGDYGQEYGWANGALKSKMAWKRAYAPSENFQYWKGAQDLLLNLGYTEDDSDGIILNFIAGGAYHFDNISIIVQPMEHYAEQVEALRMPVENLLIDYNQVTADITLEESRIVCVAIPYDKGWNARVDGNNVKLELVNGRYLGLELGKGDHHLELSYAIPGIAEGAWISVGTIFALSVCAVWNHYRKKRNRQNENE